MAENVEIDFGYNYQYKKSNGKSRADKLPTHHINYWKGNMSNKLTNDAALCIDFYVLANHKDGNYLHGWEPNLTWFKEIPLSNNCSLVKFYGAESITISAETSADKGICFN